MNASGDLWDLIEPLLSVLLLSDHETYRLDLQR